MGRMLCYGFVDATKEEYVAEDERLERVYREHLSKSDESRSNGCKCGDCKQYFSFGFEFSEDDNHQRKWHDLPYEGLFSRQELIDMLKKFVANEKWYEAEVIAKVLDEFHGETCVFRYN